MFFKVENLPESGVEFEKDVDLRARIEGYEEVQDLQQCTIAGTIRSIGRERYQVEGNFSFRAEMVCTRCLAVFPHEREKLFALRFFPTRENIPLGDDEQEVDRSLLDVAYYQLEDGIDLQQIAEEQLNLCLSMKILCREDCKGLCATCGVNLNQGSCSCPADDIDPRLAALKKLLKQDDGS
jgi:uncharacterized protein